MTNEHETSNVDVGTYTYKIVVERKENGWAYHLIIGNMIVTGSNYVGRESAFESAKLMADVIRENLEY